MVGWQRSLKTQDLCIPGAESTAPPQPGQELSHTGTDQLHLPGCGSVRCLPQGQPTIASLAIRGTRHVAGRKWVKHP